MSVFPSLGRCPALVVALAFLGQGWVPAQDADAWRTKVRPGIRFAAYDVMVDSGAQPLAAYQVAIAATSGEIRIVGIEGGAQAPFKQPPYYDPKALQRERAILAAFSTADAPQLPRGRTRVATLHVQVTGPATPMFLVRLETATSTHGSPLQATAYLKERTAP